MRTGSKRLYVLFGALVAVASRAPAVTPAAVAVNPTADAFLTTGPTGNLSGNNYGAAGALAVAAPGSPKGEFQSVLKFDPTQAQAAFNAAYGAGHWTIQSATLTLTSAANNSTSFFNATTAGSFTVGRMQTQNDAYAEGTGMPNSNPPKTDGITYNSLIAAESNAPDETVGTFSFSGSTSGATTYTLPLTPQFVSDLSSGTVTSLRLFAADAQIAYLFNSNNFGTAGSPNRPVLTITAVPEPTAGAAVFAGVTLLSRRRRR